MVEQEYREHSAISQSQLKLLLGPNPNVFNTVREPELYFEEKKHFTVGNAVDCLLTQPREEFERKFHISTIENKPSDTIKSIVNQVFDLVKEEVGELADKGVLRDHTSKIVDCCIVHNYQPNWKTETRIAKVLEAYEYWEDLKQAEGKTVLSEEERNLIDQIVMSIRTNSVTAPYFEGGKNIEIRFQVPILFDILEVNCKALLDMIIIDHNKKTIQPIDIKTMGDHTIYFPKSLRQRRYDIQAAFYTRALKSRVEFQEYEILPFKFIVESTINPGNPLVFTCDRTLLEVGKLGRAAVRLSGISETKLTSIYYGKVEAIKGYMELLDDYKWYMEHGFEVPRSIKAKEGELDINWNGII